MKTQTKVIAGVLVGAAVVAAVGVLISSERGSAVRGEVADYFADLIDSIKSKAQATANNVSSLKDDAVNNARNIVKRKVDTAADAAISAN
ncbi:YtxH domain-containing protein [Mucilaginibacter sp. HMF5004]|uniref:YtxH domain-containing protein n=1 Tax=Mucilaginibacter rivuli TaxID=2857527 RepID=UPI001C5D5B3F|nr:YtxH domain-containing protein [Mucilaginibacter rivuli]MBW4889181.1 YtxH domain-containing protein [Mucilaginibacter rivuli]